MKRTYLALIALLAIAAAGWQDIPGEFLQRTRNHIKDYGAVGNGTTDDSAAFTRAISALSAGDTLVIDRPASFYKVTTQVVVNKSLRIVGDGWYPIVKNTASDQITFEITASDVSIEGLDIRCAAAAVPFTGDARPIYVHGADNTHYLNNIRIRDCKFTLADYGIYAKYVTDFDFSGNVIDNVSYAGIYALSVNRGVIDRNVVTNVLDEANFPYGIAVSNDAAPNDPRSSDVVVSNNVVEDVPWEALDTHGGLRITFTGNTAYNCKRGIAAVPESGATPQWAPEQITIVGNTLDSARTDGSGSQGIAVTGVVKAGDASTSDFFAKGCTIAGNTVKGFGDQSSNFHGGIYAHNTLGLSVTGNSTIDCSAHGIVLDVTNFGFVVTGNTAQDPWSTAISGPCLVMVYGQYNQGYVGENTLVDGDKSAANLRQCGVRLNSTNQSVVLGPNKLQLDSGGVAFIDTNNLGKYQLAALVVSTTWDPPQLYPGEWASTTITATGGSTGDRLIVGFGTGVPAGLQLTGVVSSANTITATLRNAGTGIVDLASGTLRAEVLKRDW